MSSLIKNSIVLTITRVLKYVIQFLSPILLVRILDLESFGRYQEFMIYSMTAATFINFSINNNLLYFIAKEPKREKTYLTNTTGLLVLFSLAGIFIIYIMQDYLLKFTTYNFINLLVLYLLVFVNFNFIESYWLAKRKTTLVLYYSLGYTIIQISSVIIAAYVTKSVNQIIIALILINTIKCLGIASYLGMKRLISIRAFDVSLLINQLHYIVPLGSAASILYFNVNVSKFLISSQLGAAMLAIYAIGSRQVPIINIVRSSVTDIIFPEMVAKKEKNMKLALKLWQSANIVYLYILSPLFFVLLYFSEIIITTLFTNQYSAAVPIFRIYLLLILRSCFEMGAPLRAINKNKFFIIGNLLSFMVNAVLIVVLFHFLGMIGPAIAYVITELFLIAFLAKKIMKSYDVPLSKLLVWKKVYKILIANMLCLPILFLDLFININALIAAVGLSTLYFIAYFLIFKRIKVDEVDRVMGTLFHKLRLAW